MNCELTLYSVSIAFKHHSLCLGEKNGSYKTNALKSQFKTAVNLQHQGWFVYRGKRKWSPKEALRSSCPCSPGSLICRWRCDQKATRDQGSMLLIRVKSVHEKAKPVEELLLAWCVPLETSISSKSIVPLMDHLYPIMKPFYPDWSGLLQIDSAHIHRVQDVSDVLNDLVRK